MRARARAAGSSGSSYGGPARALASARAAFGARIAEGRAALGLSQRDLARALEIDCSLVARLELGENRRFDPRTLGRVAKLMGLERAPLLVAFGSVPDWMLAELLAGRAVRLVVGASPKKGNP